MCGNFSLLFLKSMHIFNFSSWLIKPKILSGSLKENLTGTYPRGYETLEVTWIVIGKVNYSVKQATSVPSQVLVLDFHLV